MGRRFGRPQSRHLAVLAAALVILPVLAQYAYVYTPPPAWSLRGGPGVLATGGQHAVVPAEQASGTTYVSGTSIGTRADGTYLVPGPGNAIVEASGGPAVDAAIQESHIWLASGKIPGAGTRWRDMAERALLDIRALTTTGGGVVAAWHGPWAYVWPRDASFAAAAYCVTGQTTDGTRVLDFLAHAQDEDGTWAARYRPDGRPVADGRTRQLDANGWIPWSAWLCATTTDNRARHWPMVRAAADAAVRSLGPQGLPPPSPDYWETDADVTLGTAAPLLAGLRAAADLAATLGHTDEARLYETSARTLDTAIDTHFGRTNYQRQPQAGSGHDAAVTFLAPPFAATDARVASAVAETAETLTVPNGGVKPGEKWRGHPGEAWTPETAAFALAAAASGDDRAAGRWLDWLDTHRTTLGALPERVSATGEPVSVAPLGWTSALVVLALAAMDESLPTPPE